MSLVLSSQASVPEAMNPSASNQDHGIGIWFVAIYGAPGWEGGGEAKQILVTTKDSNA